MGITGGSQNQFWNRESGTIKISCLERQYNPSLVTLSIPGKENLTNIENSK